MQSIRTFLARAVPWPTQGETWWINIHAASTFNGRKSFPGRSFKELERAAQHVEWLMRERPSDIYVCMSAQALAHEKVGKNGYRYYTSFRSTETAVALRSIWMDVDVKPTGFPTTDAALAAFQTFAKAVGLPMPTFIVLSGSGGFHAHWVTEDPLDVPSWSRLAHGLVNAAIQQGFKVDTGVTIDSARLLRVPDTLNFKTDPPNRVTLAYAGAVYSVARLEAALQPFFGPPSAVPAGRVQRTILPGQSVLGPNFKPKAPISDSGLGSFQSNTTPPTLASVVAACPWMAHVAATHGADQPEPLWREALKVAYFTSEARPNAHRLSAGHPGYSQADTDAKFDRVVLDQTTRDYGWPRCATIHSLGAEQCRTCPNLAKDKTPLHFVVVEATVTSAGTPPTSPPGSPPPGGTQPPPPPPPPQPTPGTPGVQWPDLPFGFQRDPDGNVYTVADEGQMLFAAKMPILNLRAVRPPNKKDARGFMLQFDTDLAGLGSKEITFSYEQLGDYASLARTIFSQGFVYSSQHAPTFRLLMTSFVEELRAKARSVITTEPMGWSEENTDAFVYGGIRYNGTGNVPVLPPDPVLSKQYQPLGSMQVWRDAAKLIEQRNAPALDAIIATSFAAPLVACTGHGGLVVSAFSEASGVGKTTAMRVAQAVWGHATKGMAGLDDTPNYVNHRLSIMRHLPFYYDEVRGNDHTEKLATLIFAVGQGKTKGRLNRSSTGMPVDDYNTMLVAASNNSLIEYMNEHVKTTTAGMLRLFEFDVGHGLTSEGRADTPNAQITVGALNANFGHAGAMYSEYLGQNAAKVRHAIEKCNEALQQELQASNDERFLLGSITTMYVGSLIAQKQNIVNLQPDRLRRFLAQQFENLRSVRSKSSANLDRADNVVDYLSLFLNDHRQQTLVTDKVWLHPYRPPTGWRVTLKSDPTKVIGRLVAHVSEDDKLVRISVTAFNYWLKQKYNTRPAPIIRHFTSMLGMKPIMSRIGVGTAYQTAAERLMQFDLTTLPPIWTE